MNPSIDFHAYTSRCVLALIPFDIHFDLCVHGVYVKAGGAEAVHTDTTERAQPLGED